MPKTIYITTIILFSAWLLAGCGGDSADDVRGGVKEPTQQEISLKAGVDELGSETRAASFYENSSRLQTNGFTVNAYNSDGTKYIDGKSVSYDTDNTRWYFTSGSVLWPETGNLDFFAYTTTGVNYITNISYDTSTDNVSFTCNGYGLYNSTNQNGKSEFICALTKGQNRNNAVSGVNLSFMHSFARVKFVQGTVNQTYNSGSSSGTYSGTLSVGITLQNISLIGTCTFGGSSTVTWNDLSATSNFEASSFSNDAYYIFVPQTITGKTLAIDASYKATDNSAKYATLTSAFPTCELQAGKSYTFTINLTLNTDPYGGGGGGSIDQITVTVNTSKYTEQW